MTPEFIDTPEALAAFCDALQTQDCIAVDTEFARETSYFPHIGLIQIAGGNRIACIDPLAFDASAQLTRLFSDKSITKVFHACLQDLEVLELTMGTVPCPLFDTQIAIALTTEDHQISYARLVEQALGIELAKSETRTNWLKRPLTEAQLAYAADDVRFLLQLHAQLGDELAALNRTAWMLEDCERLCQFRINHQDNLRRCWTRVKGKERLRGIELAVLQQAAIWREQQAIALDRTRRRILPDDHMVKIAVKQPRNLTELSRIGRIGKYLQKAELDSLQEILAAAYRLPKSEWPTLKRRQLTQDQSAALNAVLERLRKTAADLGISPGMLCNRKDAEKLVLGETALAVLSGWRRECVGGELLKLLPDSD